MLPSILDFEASGFGPDSYPIEVGFVLSSGERYCRLIQPFDDWQFWREDAERLHGISRDTLITSGIPAAQVCEELNTKLSGLTLYSDAWVYDDPWLKRLFHCAQVTLQFQLRAIEHIQSECQNTIWDETRRSLLASAPPSERHRASADAEFIQRVYAQTRTLCDSSTLTR